MGPRVAFDRALSPERTVDEDYKILLDLLRAQDVPEQLLSRTYVGLQLVSIMKEWGRMGVQKADEKRIAGLVRSGLLTFAEVHVADLSDFAMPGSDSIRINFDARIASDDTESLWMERAPELLTPRRCVDESRTLLDALTSFQAYCFDPPFEDTQQVMLAMQKAGLRGELARDCSDLTNIVLLRAMQLLFNCFGLEYMAENRLPLPFVAGRHFFQPSRMDLCPPMCRRTSGFDAISFEPVRLLPRQIDRLESTHAHNSAVDAKPCAAAEESNRSPRPPTGSPGADDRAKALAKDIVLEGTAQALPDRGFIPGIPTAEQLCRRRLSMRGAIEALLISCHSSFGAHSPYEQLQRSAHARSLASCDLDNVNLALAWSLYDMGVVYSLEVDDEKPPMGEGWPPLFFLAPANVDDAFPRRRDGALAA